MGCIKVNEVDMELGSCGDKESHQREKGIIHAAIHLLIHTAAPFDAGHNVCLSAISFGANVETHVRSKSPEPT